MNGALPTMISYPSSTDKDLRPHGANKFLSSSWHCVIDVVSNTSVIYLALSPRMYLYIYLHARLTLILFLSHFLHESTQNASTHTRASICVT